eukprot:EC725251.1.p1 GENE.EC725251.1~~EC725251.1.p1  ORF type:complete len:120 (+),score=18.60 EC725251.1:52-411(+)
MAVATADRTEPFNLSTFLFGSSKMRSRSGVGLHFGERAARGFGVDATKVIADVMREVCRDFGMNIGAVATRNMVEGMKHVVVCVKWASAAAMVICFLYNLPRIIRALRGQSDTGRQEQQ